MPRPLTPGEITLARAVFGDNIDYSDIKINNKKYWFGQPKDVGMSPNGNIYLPGNTHSEDFSKLDIKNQAFFIHEMTHVWQYQKTGIHLGLQWS